MRKCRANRKASEAGVKLPVAAASPSGLIQGRVCAIMPLANIGLWVHLFMNYLMILPFGCVLEAEAGSKNTFIVFIAAMILSSITFQILLYGQDELACGVSAVGYAFVTGGIVNIRSLWKTYAVRTRRFYSILCVVAVIMLLPMITGWISTCLHLFGILSYFAASFIIRRSEAKTRS